MATIEVVQRIKIKTNYEKDDIIIFNYDDIIEETTEYALGKIYGYDYDPDKKMVYYKVFGSNIKNLKQVPTSEYNIPESNIVGVLPDETYNYIKEYDYENNCKVQEYEIGSHVGFYVDDGSEDQKTLNGVILSSTEENNSTWYEIRAINQENYVVKDVDIIGYKF